jgi:hypothetical protein
MIAAWACWNTYHKTNRAKAICVVVVGATLLQMQGNYLV